VRKAAPSPGRPEEMTNAQADAEMQDQSSRAGEVPGSRRGGKRGAGGAGKKKLITIEAGICMKTNKTMTICPAKKGHFCITKRHFMQRHTYFAKIGGFLVAFRALKKRIPRFKMCKLEALGDDAPDDSPTPKGLNEVFLNGFRRGYTHSG